MKRVFATASSMALACAMVATVWPSRLLARRVLGVPSPSTAGTSGLVEHLREDCNRYRLSGRPERELHPVERVDGRVRSRQRHGGEHEPVFDRQLGDYRLRAAAPAQARARAPARQARPTSWSAPTAS